MATAESLAFPFSRPVRIFQAWVPLECDIGTYSMAELLLMRNICKSFSGVPVLQAVGFDLNPGEVHVLAGENGAGKTTLINILAGVHTDYSGEIKIDGQPVRFLSPHDAARKGISVIHQEMSLIESLPVIDNIFLGREITRHFSSGLLVDRSREMAEARELSSQLDLNIDFARPVEDFPLSIRNRIEIAKALALNVRILIMDEPTSALSAPEVERLFLIIARLKQRGCGIIYITHRMEEIYRVADRITVLRDGRRIGTAPAPELGESDLIRWMLGRDLAARLPNRQPALGEERLRVEHFFVTEPVQASTRKEHYVVEDACFAVRSGEILGLAGLQGSGASALLAGLFGTFPNRVEGDVYLDGRRFSIRSPRRSIRSGLAYLGSDRRGTGLIYGMDVAQNVSLASLLKLSTWGVLRKRREWEVAAAQVQSLAIRGASLQQDVQNLSGGNQQKVLLAKWIETSPIVFLLDEPTRGIDVGAKQEIYSLIRRWTAEGMAVVLITSELQELMDLADRILVMHRGRITAEFSREQASQEKILRVAMGGTWVN
jgi:ribose transport system ATP-binding protein